MPAPSPTWTTKSVRVTYRNPGTAALEVGTWYATLVGRTVNVAADGTRQIFRSSEIARGSLNTNEPGPSLTVDLPVVDDPDNSPQGGKIVLKIVFAAGDSETFELAPLTAWPTSTDLANYLFPGATTDPPSALIVGVPGGVARLNAQGKVVDSTGAVVTGGSGSGASNAAGITDSTVVGRAVLTAADAATARSAIGAGTSSLTTGTTASTAAVGNDSRLSDARTPTAHQHPTSDVTGLDVALAGKVGTGDPRLTDNRTPTDNSVTAAKIVDGTVGLVELADAVKSAFLTPGTKLVAYWDPTASVFRDLTGAALPTGSTRPYGRADVAWELSGGPVSAEPAWSGQCDTHVAVS